MSYASLEKKMNNLTIEQQESVFDYINFLLYRNNVNKKKVVHRTPGGLKGSFYMADDFDKTPECFDRLIISQSIIENLILITKDSNIPYYPVKTVW